MKRILYRCAMRLLNWSGDAGANAWREMGDRMAAAEKDYFRADAERWRAVKRLQILREATETADSLLSAGMADEAQKQLRVAIIAERRP